jgi:hypothetical protein
LEEVDALSIQLVSGTKVEREKVGGRGNSAESEEGLGRFDSHSRLLES